MFKLGGVDTSPSYLLFLTPFLLFWTLICMIWMKLTQTDTIFSRTTMVLFLCRNKSSWIGLKLCEDFYSIMIISGAKNHRRGAPGWAQPTRACPPLLARPGGLSPPCGPADPETDAIKSYFSRKNPGRKNYRDPWDGAAAKPCSSSGEQIWSPFGAPERGIFFVLRHHQPISIANSMMLPAGSE